jgi:hypothetical protein
MHWARMRKRGTTDPYRGKGGLPNHCSVDGCDRKLATSGMCWMHAGRVRRRGTTEKHERTSKPYIDSQGYVRVYVDGKRQGQFEHRVVMEGILGRPLRREENVHHKNGVRTDNRPSNLELWSSSQPSGQRVTDKLAWAREILAAYSGEEQLIEHLNTLKAAA